MRNGRMSRASFSVLVALVGVAAACAPTNIKLQDTLAVRASFDLGCPKDQLKFVPFSENEMYVTAYGVTGCGQRAAYLLHPGPTWSLDARFDDKEAKPPPPAPPDVLGPPPLIGEPIR